MKTRLSKAFQLLFLSAFLMVTGCKEKKPADTEPLATPETPRIDVEAVQEQSIAAVLNSQGAAIRLTVTDAQSLFDTEEPSVIDEEHPGLHYISMKSEGQKTEDGAETNDSIDAKGFESSVYRGRTTIWRLSLDQTNPNNRNYSIEVQEIDFGVDPDNPCQAYEKVMYPRGNDGLVRAQVSDTVSIGCRQPYAIIFSLHHNEKDISRTFVLDPWVIVR
jgi:hypothetical protein